MENITPADLITFEEAAEVLDVPVATLRTWRINGKGPRAARIGRRLLFVREEVETYYAREFAAQNKAV